MVDNVEFSLIGLEELRTNLQQLSKDAEAKGARFAGRKAANIIRDAAIANAKKIDDPDTPEDISQNIAIRFSTSFFKKTGDIKYRIGVLGGAKKSTSDATNAGGNTWYWRLIELGTSRTAANPFMLPALTQNIDKVTSEFSSQFSKWIDRRVKKLKKAQQ